MVDTSRLADALLGYQVPSEDAQFPYPSLADALASSDAGARTQIYGPKGTLARDKADFSAQVHSGLRNYLAGAQAMVPQTNERAAEMAAYATPILGNALSARDAYEAAKQGDWRGTALGAIGAVPFIGGMASSIEKTPFGLVHINPTKSEIKAISERSPTGTLRSLTDATDDYVWPGYNSTHEPMIDQLGLDSESIGRGYHTSQDLVKAGYDIRALTGSGIHGMNSQEILKQADDIAEKIRKDMASEGRSEMTPSEMAAYGHVENLINIATRRRGIN